MKGIIFPWELFWVVAGIHSFLYGVKCFQIHFQSTPPKTIEYKYAEYLFNGLGAFIGWIALYFVFHLSWNNPDSFGWQHLVLSYVAYIGISGQLPFVAKFGFIKG